MTNSNNTNGLPSRSDSGDFVEMKTIDNTRVRFQRSQVGAIEEIPGSARTEPSVKVYTAGFAFNVRLTLDEATKAIFG